MTASRSLFFDQLAKILFTCSACMVFAPLLHGETLYYENFSSGEESLSIWQNVWGNNATATDDGLRLNGNGATLITGLPAVQNLETTSIRAQIVFDGSTSSGVALVTNGDPADGNAANVTAYQAGINPNDNRLYIGANVPGAYRHFTGEENVEFDLKSGDEVILQLDVAGNQLDLWAWRPDEPMPLEPRLTYVDENIQYGPGVPGVLFDALGSNSTATYRYIHVASESIPEPSSVLLLCVGLLGICCLRKRRRHIAIAVTLMAPIALSVTVCEQSATAQTILIDDFSNPDLAGWFNTETYSEKAWGPGILEVRDGELFYGTTGTVPAGSETGLNVTGFALSQWNASSIDTAFENGTLRAKVRAEAPAGSTEAGNVAMYMRGNLSTLTAYVVGAIGSNKAFVLDKFVNGSVAEQWEVEGVNFTLNEDWFMELGAIGSELSVKVWKASDVEPLEPQLSVMDTDIPSGTIGLTAAMSPSVATEDIALGTYYDDVTFTVPEPSCLPHAFSGLLGTLLLRTRRRAKA